MNARFKGVMLGMVAAGSLAISGQALAQDAGTDGPPPTPSCGDTTLFPNPIYITGSTAFEPTALAMGVQLSARTAGTGKVSLLYVQGSGSCSGVAAVKDNSDLTGVAHYFPAGLSGSTPSCTIPAGVKADLAVSDVFYETCGLGTRASTITDALGPAQAMIIVVPAAAATAPLSITVEEAADVWGCGQRGMVMPWIVETAIQQRSQSSGTQNVVARAINVLASAFHGTQNTGTGNVINSLLNMDNDNTLRPTMKLTIADPNTAIGFIAADAYDTGTNRRNLRALAFRGFEQNLAYYADSAPDVFDKANVREGHYVVWGYEHLITRIDTGGAPLSSAAKSFID